MSQKRHLKRPYLWLLFALTLYTIVGFLVVPRYLETQLRQLSKTHLNSGFEFEKIRFNPFRFSADIYSPKWTDQDNKTWLTASRMHANLDLFASIFDDISVSKVQIDQPNFQAHWGSNESGSPLKYPKLRSNDTESNEIIGFSISEIELNNGIVELFNQNSQGDPVLEVTSIEVKISDFYSNNYQSRFDIHFQTEKDNKVGITGSFDMTQKSSEGHFTFQKVSTQSLFSALGDPQQRLLGLRNKTGNIQGEGTYRLILDSQLDSKIHISHLTLNDFETQEELTHSPWIKAPHLEIHEVSVNPFNKKIKIKSVVAEQATIKARFTSESQLIWPGLYEFLSVEDSHVSSSSGEFQLDQFSAPKLTLTLYKDRSGINNEQTFDLINISITNLGTAASSSQLSMNIAPFSKGSIKLRAEVQWNPFLAKIATVASSLNLELIQPWFPENLLVTIASGKTNFDQNITLANNHYEIEGSLELKDITLLDNSQVPFYQNDHLQVSSVIDSNMKTIEIRQLKLDHSLGRLLLDSEGNWDLSSVLLTDDIEEVNFATDSIDKTDWKINILLDEMKNRNPATTDDKISNDSHNNGASTEPGNFNKSWTQTLQFIDSPGGHMTETDLNLKPLQSETSLLSVRNEGMD